MSTAQLLVAYCSLEFLFAWFPNFNSTHILMNSPSLSLNKKIGWCWISLRCCTKDPATHCYDDMTVVSHNVFTPTRKAVDLVPSTLGRGFGELIPQTKFQATPNWNMKHTIQWRFCQTLECQLILLHKRKAIEDFLATVLSRLKQAWEYQWTHKYMKEHEGKYVVALEKHTLDDTNTIILLNTNTYRICSIVSRPWF